MSEKLPTVVKYQAGSTEQRNLMINCEGVKSTGRASTKCQMLGAKRPQSYCDSIRNPWLLRCGVTFIAIVFVVIFVSLYSKMQAKVEEMEAKLSQFELLVAMQDKVNELEDRIHCSVIESNGTNRHGRSCAEYAEKKGQLTGPTTSASVRNTNQKGGRGDAASIRSANANKKTTSAQKLATDEVKTSPVNTVYVAWGVTKCPNTYGTSKLYSGTVASSEESAFLCLPNSFHYENPKDISDTDRAQLHPVRYGNSVLFEPPWNKAKNFARNNSEVPCAMCQHSNRSAVLVEPAATDCHENWQKEYHGYLMTSGTEFICVNKYAESINVNNGHVQDRAVPGLQFAQFDYDPAHRKNAAVTCVVCLK